MWMKIGRARQHIEELRRALTEYANSVPCTVVREADPDEPGWLRARIDGEPKPIPDEVPLILGDAVHNLRTSLDYFA